MSINDRNRDDRLNADDPTLRANERTLREDEARLTLSEEELAVGKRRVEAGEVGLRKTVETEHVAQSVPVMHEEVTVERRPITDAHLGDARISEEEIRVPVSREEVVAEKRVVAKEELVVKKHAVQGEQHVEADLRRERAEVDRQGSVEMLEERRDDRL
ncbi:MAG TPA: YsnF/AvaK domain-containing protein [Longimicrobiaceae bacterium]